jgi:WD40 repeat protein
VESGDCIKILNGHTEEVYIIVKHSNECVLSGSGDKTIKLWNFYSGECLRTFTGLWDQFFVLKRYLMKE